MSEIVYLMTSLMLLFDRSKGFLCLPKHFSHDLGHALDRVCNGQFRFLVIFLLCS